MKKIFETIFILLTLSIVTLMFDLVHVNASTTVSIVPSSSYYIRYENDSRFTRPYWEHVTAKGSFPINHYFGKISVMTNATTKYYKWTNDIVFGYPNQKDNFNCEDGYGCIISGNIMLRDTDYFRNPKLTLKNASVYYSESFNYLDAVYPDDKNDKFDSKKCSTSIFADDIIYFKCNISKNNYSDFFIRIILNDRIYEDYYSTDVYSMYEFALGISADFNYDCTDVPYPIIELKETGGIVPYLHLVNASDFVKNSKAKHLRYIISGDSLTKDYTYTGGINDNPTNLLSQLPNGSYRIQAFVLDEYLDPLSESNVINYDRTNSLIPVLKFVLSEGDNDKTIKIDASDSYATQENVTISQYCFAKDATLTASGVYTCSSSPIYTFVYDDYGSYEISGYVVDSNGNKSMIQSLDYRLLTPEEKKEQQQKNFFEKVTEAFNNMWTDFGKMMKQLFVPSESELSNWFNDVNTSLTEQFGFLSYPFTWVITFLQRFTELTDTGSYIISWSDIKVPNFDYVIISKGSFDLASLLNNSNIKTMHDIYLMCIDALVILSFFNYCSNVYNRIFGNNDIYETDILSASQNYTIDDKQQVHKSVTASKTHVEKRTRKKV